MLSSWIIKILKLIIIIKRGQNKITSQCQDIHTEQVGELIQTNFVTQRVQEQMRISAR